VTLSKSPGRGGFQKDAYVKRCEAEGKLPSEEYLQMYNSFSEHAARAEASEEFKKDNLEYDLRSTDWILEKVRNSKTYAQNLYAAMCNNEFQKMDVFPILADKTCSYSWRYAGGIIADMRQEGDYIDWYCSGIQDSEAIKANNGIVSESVVTEEIESDLNRLGWRVLDQEDEA
jgi:hypothetical protein